MRPNRRQWRPSPSRGRPDRRRFASNRRRLRPQPPPRWMRWGTREGPQTARLRRGVGSAAEARRRDRTGHNRPHQRPPPHCPSEHTIIASRSCTGTPPPPPRVPPSNRLQPPPPPQGHTTERRGDTPQLPRRSAHPGPSKPPRWCRVVKRSPPPPLFGARATDAQRWGSGGTVRRPRGRGPRRPEVGPPVAPVRDGRTGRGTRLPREPRPPPPPPAPPAKAGGGGEGEGGCACPAARRGLRAPGTQRAEGYVRGPSRRRPRARHGGCLGGGGGPPGRAPGPVPTRPDAGPPLLSGPDKRGRGNGALGDSAPLKPQHLRRGGGWTPHPLKGAPGGAQTAHPPPHSAQPRHTNDWAPRTRKRHQQEHRPQRPTERSDPTQHAKGRTGDCPGPRKGAKTRRNVTQGGGGGHVGSHHWVDAWLYRGRAPFAAARPCVSATPPVCPSVSAMRTGGRHTDLGPRACVPARETRGRSAGRAWAPVTSAGLWGAGPWDLGGLRCAPCPWPRDPLVTRSERGPASLGIRCQTQSPPPPSPPPAVPGAVADAAPPLPMSMALSTPRGPAVPLNGARLRKGAPPVPPPLPRRHLTDR